MLMGQITIIEGLSEQVNQVFLIPEGKKRLLGRSSICHFKMNDPLISSMQCVLYEKEGNFLISDLLSANGVYVNDFLVNEHNLKENDRIRIGKTLLEFSIFKEKKEEGKIYITGDKLDITNIDEEKPDKEAGISNSFNKNKEVPLGRLIKKQSDLNICRLALKNEMIAHKDIKAILKIQERESLNKKKLDLSQILVLNSMIKKEDIENLTLEHKYYKIRNKDIFYAKIIVKEKMATEEKVQESLDLQDRYFRETKQCPRLGELLVQKGYITIQQNNKIIKAILKSKNEKL